MNMGEKGSNEGSHFINHGKLYIYIYIYIYLPSIFYRLILGKQKLRTTLLQGREEDAAWSKNSTNTINDEQSYKVKTILNSKSYYFPLARLLFGLYDYSLEHISIFDYNNDHKHDQAHNNQSRGQLLFQEREDDADILTDQAVTQVDEHNTQININQGPITRSQAKKLRQEVDSLLAEINFNISENAILPKCSKFVLLRCICERGGAAIHREEAKKKKQVDQFGQGGSSKFSSDKSGQVRTGQFGQSVQTCSDLHNDLIKTLKSR
jgi:hypothetical protein